VIDIDMNKLPPISHAHLEQAFALMRWKDWTLEAALRNDMRRRIVVARAHRLRTDEYLATLTDTAKKAVRRVRVDREGNEHWVTQLIYGPRQAAPDLFNPGEKA